MSVYASLLRRTASVGLHGVHKNDSFMSVYTLLLKLIVSIYTLLLRLAASVGLHGVHKNDSLHFVIQTNSFCLHFVVEINSLSRFTWCS